MTPGDDRNVTYRRRRNRSQDPPPEREEEVVLGEDDVEGEAHSGSDKGKGTMGDEMMLELTTYFIF
jgi:hypothetical protein